MGKIILAFLLMAGVAYAGPFEITCDHQDDVQFYRFYFPDASSVQIDSLVNSNGDMQFDLMTLPARRWLRNNTVRACAENQIVDNQTSNVSSQEFCSETASFDVFLSPAVKPTNIKQYQPVGYHTTGQH